MKKKQLITINIYDKKTKDHIINFMQLNFLKTYTSAIRFLLNQNKKILIENKKLKSQLKTYEIRQKFKKP